MKTTKSDRCIEELRKIIEIEGISGQDGVKARREALESWLDDWVCEVNFSQPIISKNLTSEQEDYLKYYSAYKLGEELMEECVDLDSTKTGLKLKVKALRR